MSNGTNDDKNAPIPSPEEPISPPAEPDPPMPSPEADYLALGVYVRDRFQARQQFEDQATGLGRRSAVQMWYAGAALDIIHRRETKEKSWKNWCNTLGFNVGTCYEAMRLYKRSGSVENIRGMTITEARSTYKTDKGTWTPPGAEPPATEVTEPTTEGIAATTATTPGPVADGPQGGAEGNEPMGILGRLREDLDDLAELADSLARPGTAIEADDASTAIKRIDEVVAKLREAKKTLMKSAKVNLKSSSKVIANATVRTADAKIGDDR
jgi:hypothetical protein